MLKCTILNKKMLPIILNLAIKGLKVRTNCKTILNYGLTSPLSAAECS